VDGPVVFDFVVARPPRRVFASPLPFVPRRKGQAISSYENFLKADGSVEKTEADADLAAVRRLFELLLKFTQKDVPGFQIIVTEHANLSDRWFQDVLVEQPWANLY